MTKTYCDICGKELLTSMPHSIEGSSFCISSFGRIWDICNDCKNDLDKFLNNHKEDKK